MTDKAYVIGVSTPEANAARFPLLPPQLPQAMGELYQTDNIVVGAPSLGQMIQAKNNRYVITRDQAFQPPEGLEDTMIITDYMELVNQYKDSDEELLVVGGATIFKLFLPFTASFDVALSDESVPGDVIFDDWDYGDFEVAGSKTWEGFTIYHYVRKRQSQEN